MKCFDNNKHKSDYLEEITSDDTAFESKVVRWCRECGAIVIDSDVDGRTWPGNIMNMRFPNVTHNQHQK